MAEDEPKLEDEQVPGAGRQVERSDDSDDDSDDKPADRPMPGPGDTGSKSDESDESDGDEGKSGESDDESDDDGKDSGKPFEEVSYADTPIEDVPEPEKPDVPSYGEDDEQGYVKRDGLDFDPDDGLYTGTAVDGGATEIPDDPTEEQKQRALEDIKAGGSGIVTDDDDGKDDDAEDDD